MGRKRPERGRLTAGRKENLKIKLVPCLTTNVLCEMISRKGTKKIKEDFHGRYWRHNENDLINFLTKNAPYLQEQFQSILPFLNFKIETVDNVETTKYFKLRNTEGENGEEETIQLDEPTKNFLKDLYFKHTKNEPRKDSKTNGLATRVAAVFWGLFRCESYYLDHAGLPYMWTNALRELFNYWEDKTKKEAFFGWMLHEFVHGFGIGHHEGKKCVMNSTREIIICEDCLNVIQYYVEDLK